MSTPELEETGGEHPVELGTWLAGASFVSAKDGSCQALFEGLLYNAKELRKELGLPEGATPPELVLAGYSRWGAEVLPRLRGVFAVLVSDHERHTLISARDPVGIHPLFYARAGGEVLLSASIQTLVDHPGVGTSVNRIALADHLCHRWPDREETYFEAVRRVPPGHALEVSRSGTRLYRYWEPVPADQEVNWVTEDELELFDDLLDRVLDRTIDGGRAGVWLSGGLDSVTITAIATDRCRQLGWPDPVALSLIFPHPDANEERIQRGVAEGLGLSHEVMGFMDAVGEKGMLPSALEISQTWPAPLLSFFLPAYQTLGLEGRGRGCTTILTGSGGDEWLSVSPTYAADMLWAFDFRGIYRLGTSNYRSFRISRLRAMRNLLWRFGANPLLKAGAVATLERTAPWALRTYRHERVTRSTPAWVAPDPVLRGAIEQRAMQRSKHRFGDFYMSEVRETFDHPLVAMEMEESFENSRRFGVRLGQPFLDADIIDFLCRTPPELLIRGGRSKAVVRQTLARRFPELGFERQRKVVANSFSRPLLASEGARLWKEMGGAPSLVETGIVDRAEAERCVQEVLAHKATGAYAYRLWDMLSLEAWLRPRL